jgi:hypothetical protein
MARAIHEDPRTGEIHPLFVVELRLVQARGTNPQPLVFVPAIEECVILSLCLCLLHCLFCSYSLSVSACFARVDGSWRSLNKLVSTACNKMMEVLDVVPRLTLALSATLAAAPTDADDEPGSPLSLSVCFTRICDLSISRSLSVASTNSHSLSP